VQGIEKETMASYGSRKCKSVKENRPDNTQNEEKIDDNK